MSDCRTVLLCILPGALMLSSAPALWAANGMNLIGFGAESLAMGGADLAITASPASMNINPAGIAWADNAEIDFGLSLLYPSLNHSDRLGNDRDDSLDRYPMPFFGYIRPVGFSTFGIGVFVQGGLGAEYEDLRTPFSVIASSGMVPPTLFGTSVIPERDGLLTKLSHTKLTPSAAWRLSPTTTLGVTLNLSWARAEMKFFPETSVAADLDRSGTVGDGPREMFAGMHAEGVSAFGFGIRVGMQYRRGDLSIGAAYATETDLGFENGNMTLNLSAVGLGKVLYDAEMSGFAWPRQVGVGVGYRISPQVLMAVDLDWVDWSSAMGTLTIEIDNPRRPMAPPSRRISFPMSWEDQWVWAFGLEIKHGSRWVARFGYNHGDAPIPEATLRPQFPAIGEDHLTAGTGYRTERWIVDTALEFVTEVEKTNNGRDPLLNPFGTGSRETLSQFVAHFTVRRVLFRRQ